MTSLPPRRRPTQPATMLAAVVAVASLAVGLLAACSPGPSPSPPTSGTVAPASVAPSTSSVPTTPASPAVVVDPSLLAILPDTVDGIPIAPEAEAAARLAADPTLAESIAGLAMGLAVDSASGGGDLAIVTVVRVRPGLVNEVFLRSYRDSYDEAACAPAGGVAGNAEAELGGRRVFIGSCEGGAFTYHAQHSADVIVSVTSVGERRLGEKIMSSLEG